MGKAQVVISVLLFRQITASTFGEKANFRQEDEIDKPFYRSESMSIADEGFGEGDGSGISKGDFHFA